MIIIIKEAILIFANRMQFIRTREQVFLNKLMSMLFDHSNGHFLKKYKNNLLDTHSFSVSEDMFEIIRPV